MEHKVLIVDDSQDDSLIMKRVLSKIDSSITTEVASSGESGLTRLRKNKALPDIILLDLKMPGMDGIEMLRIIRGDGRLRHLPVVIVTHSALESDIAASYRAGADYVLHKVLDLSRFSEEVKEVLKRHLNR